MKVLLMVALLFAISAFSAPAKSGQETDLEQCLAVINDRLHEQALQLSGGVAINDEIPADILQFSGLLEVTRCRATHYAIHCVDERLTFDESIRCLEAESISLAKRRAQIEKQTIELTGPRKTAWQWASPVLNRVFCSAANKHWTVLAKKKHFPVTFYQRFCKILARKDYNSYFDFLMLMEPN